MSTKDVFIYITDPDLLDFNIMHVFTPNVNLYIV